MTLYHRHGTALPKVLMTTERHFAEDMQSCSDFLQIQQDLK